MNKLTQKLKGDGFDKKFVLKFGTYPIFRKILTTYQSPALYVVSEKVVVNGDKEYDLLINPMLRAALNGVGVEAFMKPFMNHMRYQAVNHKADGKEVMMELGKVLFDEVYHTWDIQPIPFGHTPKKDLLITTKEKDITRWKYIRNTIDYLDTKDGFNIITYLASVNKFIVVSSSNQKKYSLEVTFDSEIEYIQTLIDSTGENASIVIPINRVGSPGFEIDRIKWTIGECLAAALTDVASRFETILADELSSRVSAEIKNAMQRHNSMLYIIT